jgi:drug/metabolite transporter (DMT)-like permease
VGLRQWSAKSVEGNYFVILDSDRTGGPYVRLGYFPWTVGLGLAACLILACGSVITYSHETRERLLTALPCALPLEHPFYSIQITLKTTGWTPATLWGESMLCVFLGSSLSNIPTQNRPRVAPTRQLHNFHLASRAVEAGAQSGF